jgi:hypothetical protein
MNPKNAELKAITDTINLYVEGLHNGNIETLKKAFSPKSNDVWSKPESRNHC